MACLNNSTEQPSVGCVFFPSSCQTLSLSLGRRTCVGRRCLGTPFCGYALEGFSHCKA